MTVYRYPLQAPVPGSNDNPDSWGGTEAIDYVRFRQYFMRFDGDVSFSSETLGQTNATKVYVGGPDAVYINMPPNVQTSYNASYRKVDLGIGGAMLGAAGGTEAFSDMDKLTDALQAAAAGASPEFLNSAVAGAATGISGALGLAGNIGANELQALTKGRIFNPYSEQIFSNMSFRSHNFNFKMFARNQQEGQTIEEIIHYFKRGTHPTFQEGNLIDDPASGAAGRYNDKKGDDDKDWSKITEDWGVLKDSDMWDTQVGQNAKSQRFFKVPNKFEIEFVRLAADEANSDVPQITPNLHFKIMPSVCTAIGVNYTPDNQYNALKRIGAEPDAMSADPSIRNMSVPAVILTLQFTEVKLLTGDDVTQGY